MAIRTHTYRSSTWGGVTINYTYDAPDVPIEVSNDYFKIEGLGGMKVKSTASDSAVYPANHQGCLHIFDSDNVDSKSSIFYNTAPNYLSSNAYGDVTARPYGTKNFRTEDYFNSNNPTERTVIFSGKLKLAVVMTKGGASFDYTSDSPTVLITEYPVTLNVPPTFSNGPLEYDTNFDAPYAGLTTASVDISNLTAYYGGYITRAVLKVGNQESEPLIGDDTNILSEGTLSILLRSVGTFTPTITVEDSRGQTTTVTLADITVKGYTAPQIVVNELIRTDENGTANDEGECAVVTANFTWTSAITNLAAPTVVAKELDDTLVSTKTKWYTDRALQNEITDSDWPAVSNMPIYGFIGNNNTPPNPFDTQDSYNITITPNDGEGSGTPVTNTLGSAFYTVDFLAGGHGIAFGKPAEIPNLFDVAMPTRFNDYVQYRGGQFTLRGIFVDTQEPTSTDGEDGDIWLVYEE